MQENQFLLFLNYLRLPYSIPKSFALLLNIHVARHSFATLMLSYDVPVPVVAKMLGHASTKTTEIYAKVLASNVEAKSERVFEALK